ncbi:hypothetical protein [Modestobacter italicus]|uniref:hypothetical protein n=1 Tax=Modestobacter italicus (strain DSM 44449 / CECT 9708 / BC 501) TaxID=2732864 RepID=UPI001C949BD1|nr:hypothetical protein [Modestobacter italicus]
MPSMPVLSYRLPLTYIRVTGSRRTTADPLTGTSTAECSSTVTTEVGADLLTRCQVQLSPQRMATQKSTWRLLADGRLTGAEATTTVEPLAGWQAALQAGTAVLGAAGPALLPLGPPGWAALAGLAGVAAAGTGIAVGGGRNLFDDHQPTGDGVAPDLPPMAEPVAWDVHPRYVDEHPDDAARLATYRSAMAAGARAHAQVSQAALLCWDDEASSSHWQQRLLVVQQVVLSASIGARAAEAAYAAWRSGQLQTTVVDVDERIRVDDLPDRREVEDWARGQDGGSADWTGLADTLRVVVSVTLEAIPGDSQRLRRVDYQPGQDDGLVRYRQPRPAVLEVWEVVPVQASSDDEVEVEPGVAVPARPATDVSSSSVGTPLVAEPPRRATPRGPRRCHLRRVEVQRLLVAHPGNEAALPVESGGRSSSAVAVVFDELGALTSISAETTDSSLQRARAVSTLLPALTAAAEAGSGLRDAVSPMSLVDRAAEAAAARELGLVEAPADPLAPLRDQVAEARLRAQLKVAEQLAAASSPPVVLSVVETLSD